MISLLCVGRAVRPHCSGRLVQLPVVGGETGGLRPSAQRSDFKGTPV
jgi:hypothetical protein